MIRREINPTQCLLIEQHDHALLAGRLAERIGNDLFTAPDRQAIQAISLHDLGWIETDSRPPLNERGLPLDVFETTAELALDIWSRSADLAYKDGAYVDLLVSLHQLALSGILMQMRVAPRLQKFDPTVIRQAFEVNKFQHREIERQEALRKEIGLRTDLPLQEGLAAAGLDEAEDQLAADFYLLRAMDQISLALCCTEPPTKQTTKIIPSRGARPTALKLSRYDGETADSGKLISHLSVKPWPFNAERIEETIAGRVMPVGPWESKAAFQDAYGRTSTVDLHLLLTAD